VSFEKYYIHCDYFLFLNFIKITVPTIPNTKIKTAIVPPVPNVPITAPAILGKKPIGAYEIICGGLGSLAGVGLLIVGIIFLFAYWVVGLVMIIVGIIFLSSASKSGEKAKQIKKERKEQLIKEFQLKALKGQKWKI